MVQFGEYSGYFDTNQLVVVDTTLDNVFHFDNKSFSNLKFTGSIGAAESELHPKTMITSGFGERFFVDGIESNVLYEAKIPFVRASFVQGAKKFQKFDVQFSENINKQLGFTVNYQSLKTDGFYLNQNIDRKKFGMNAYFASRSGSVTSVIGFDLNTGVINENGGILDYSSFMDNVNSNKVGVEVSLEEAYNTLDDRRFFYDQEVRLVSLADDSIKVNNGLFLYNHVETQLGDYWYTDPKPDTFYYDTFYNVSLDSSGVWDKHKYEGFENFTALRFRSSELGDILISAGLNFKANRVFNRLFSNEFHGTSIKAILHHLTLGNLTVGGLLEYDFDGYNANGTKLMGNVNLVLIDSILDFSGDVSFVKELASFKSLQYANSFIRWDNRNVFEMPSQLTIKGGFSSSKFGAFLKGEYSSVDQYVYFDRGAKASQFSGTINLVSLALGKKIRFGDFHLDLEVRNQQKLTDGPINTPEWIVFGSLYHQRFLFSGALEIKYGFDYWQSSGYYADYYAPFIREFVYQNEREVVSYPFIDFYVGMRVKSLQGFVKATNLCQTFLKESYMMVPFYPMNDFSVMFGIQWDFFN